MLAERGDCKFYKCEESAFSCGNDGYALGYGYRYCHRFEIYYEDFDSDVSLRLYIYRHSCIVERLFARLEV